MAKRKSTEGKDLMLFLGGKPIALSNSCTLNVSRSMDEASSKDDGPYRTVTPGDVAWDISADALFSPDPATDDNTDISFVELLKAEVEGQELDAVFTIVGNPSSVGLPTGGWKPKTGVGASGKVYVNNLSATGAKGSAASMSVSFTGNGVLNIAGADAQPTSGEPESPSNPS